MRLRASKIEKTHPNISFDDPHMISDVRFQNLGEEASADYGPDGALWPLKDTCVSTKTGGYEYHVCPFKDAHQQERSSKVICYFLF